jgi:hypothetical protein
LGIIYLIAFVSLWTVDGLIGSRNLPTNEFMQNVRLQVEEQKIGLTAIAWRRVLLVECERCASPSMRRRHSLGR